MVGHGITVQGKQEKEGLKEKALFPICFEIRFNAHLYVRARVFVWSLVRDFDSIDQTELFMLTKLLN